MITLTERLEEQAAASDTLTLPYASRIRSRLRVRLDSGREAALRLQRGVVLHAGDRLAAEDGTVIEVRAAVERVSTGHTDDRLLLARASYHLGNRHVPLQVTAAWVRYQHDHVLDAMLERLGLVVLQEMAPFQPESGAYAGSGHVHAHAH
ncbi:MAG: urease accessory protein UreE [Gammaproteobacteria bacterium]|nr:urease accessory protein UreE [Gammaproteobacteria bacterium]